MLEAMRPINRSKAGIANPRGVFDPIAAFDIYLRGGLEALSPEARAVLDYQKFNAAMGTTSGRDGGFTVPDGFYRQLISAEKAYGGMLQAAKIIDTDSGNPLAIPTDDDTGNVGAILHENTQVAEVPIVFGTVALGAFTYTSGLVRLSPGADARYGVRPVGLSDESVRRAPRARGQHALHGRRRCFEAERRCYRSDSRRHCGERDRIYRGRADGPGALGRSRLSPQCAVHAERRRLAAS